MSPCYPIYQANGPGYPFNPVLDPGLNFSLPQSSVTRVSLLTGFEGQLMRALGLIPSWDS